MKVTDLQYSLEKLKVQKLDLFCERCSGNNRHQNVIGTDGREGYGKSTLTSADAYYMCYKLKRPVYLFFDVEQMTSHALRNKDSIYIWDDAAYAGLTVESYNRAIINFIKTILLARKNRNTYFINVQEIFRLKEMIVSRMIGLNHTYSRDEIKLGRFVYYRQKALTSMYYNWIRKRKKDYKSYTTFSGTFPDVLYKIFDEKEYESLKDEAIIKIDQEKVSAQKNKLQDIRYKVIQMGTSLGLMKKEIAKHMGTTQKSISEWSRDGPGSYTVNRLTKIISKGYIQPNTEWYKNNLIGDNK